MASAVLLALAAGTAAAGAYDTLSLNAEAVDGFDIVSYWQGNPQPGSRAYRAEWQGAVWLFASAGDLAAFKQAPERYAPAFGGYCAYAMSQGIEAEIHPYIYKIVEGKLLLFASFDSRDKFLADPSLLQAAQDQWSVLSKRIF